MRSGKAATKSAYVGAGAGLMLFALVGLLPSSFFGGMVGINIAGGLFGFPVTSDILPRVTVALSMLLGVLITGSVFVLCGAMIGWTMGNLIEAFPAHAYFTGRREAKKPTGEDAGQRDSD